MISEQQALQKLTAMCARAEHCRKEMKEKMDKWEIDEETQERILEYLAENKYVDDGRFARSFVTDKLTYNKWGRRKIDQALWMKGIDTETRKEALSGITDEQYIEVLRPLIKAKRKSIRARNDYEMNAKLTNFALGRGFDMRIIRQCIDSCTDADDEDMELY